MPIIALGAARSAIAGITSFMVFWTASAAPAIHEYGLVVRPDLKGPGGSGTGVGIAAASPKAVRRCDTQGTCQTPVFVFAGGAIKGAWNADGCSVYFPYSKIEIAPGKRPALRWVLIKDPADKSTYAFEKTYGIFLKNNDPTQDLAYGKVGDEGRSFTFQNLHLRKWSVNFYPRVVKVISPDTEISCDTSDPEVVNEN